MTVNIGDVVRIDYYNFDGVKSKGIYLVYAKDPPPLKSISVIKVCTRPVSFQVELPKERFPFLDHTSYANCICQQKFVEDQVIHCYGMVDTRALAAVRKQLQNVSIKIDEQLEKTIKRYNKIARAVNGYQNNIK